MKQEKILNYMLTAMLLLMAGILILASSSINELRATRDLLIDENMNCYAERNRLLTIIKIETNKDYMDLSDYRY